MAVVIETTLGDITVDLYLDQRPATCLNFLKLCKMKYYNFNLFHTIRNGFIAQTGDPTGEGSGGESIWGLLEGSSKRFFSGEKMPKIRHTDAGLISMVCTDNMMVGSQFFFTLAPDLDSLDGVHCVIGEVTEGHEVLTKLNEVICDETHRPYQDVRITHTVILEDPFNDLPGLRAPSRSPSPNAERLKGGRIAPDEEIDETQGKSHEEIQEMIEEKEAKARATILEIVGDLPDADIAPPENVLFVCKLNPVTTDDDLEIIFSRFGKIVSCEVIRDKKTGDSLQYAFIEFDDKKSCEDAYFKMDNVLIDDRRIHVDFSQSVSKMRWLGKGRGVQYFNDKESKRPEITNDRSKTSHSRERNPSRSQHNKEREIRDKDNKKHTNERNERRERDRSRSRSRRDTAKIMHKSERNRSEQHHSEERNSHKHKDKYSNKRRHDECHDSQQRSKIRAKSPNIDEMPSQTKILPPEKKHKESKNVKENYKRDKSTNEHTNNSHKASERRSRDESVEKNRKKHNSPIREHSKSKKGNSKSKLNGQALEVVPHTPTPETAKKTEESKKNIKQIKVRKSKNNVRKSEKRRKRSTSTSNTDTSESSSSSSESSSSSDGDRKKRIQKRKRRYSSSSSSTSSTSSSTSSSDSSTSSSSSTDSSVSSSDSDGDNKKRRKKNNKKSGKKTKKL